MDRKIEDTKHTTSAELDPDRLPSHIAIIMDGNGRWAEKRGLHRLKGHENAITAVRDTVEGCAELGISFLTLYAFSTENWNRPKAEVDALMGLLVKTIAAEIPTLQKNSIRLETIGDIDSLHKDTLEELQHAIATTAGNTRMTLVLALSYSARWEIVEATKAVAKRVAAGEITADDIDDTVFKNALTTRNYPDPELLIRTSGEFRISNFLLWQIAYTELYFTDIFWPDFSKEELHKAILDFQTRERRFGKTSQQLTDISTSH